MLSDIYPVPTSANDSSETLIEVDEHIPQAQTSRSGRQIRRPVQFYQHIARRGYCSVSFNRIPIFQRLPSRDPQQMAVLSPSPWRLLPGLHCEAAISASVVSSDGKTTTQPLV
ncbi:hypothetical protein AVEN_98930-1 [Araneus ventricosus]|uniref:Uncharacterized protein n=1 Tax=Araneus ventricosus TaxID=182803 RepID=A0A4Y2LCQ3_ARAVE|nr:hypothetical protein AVEN_191875-1 [Araneus ventricosus]GBN12518.1 hypothetical protein AVEN_98930-1 [Araneus ventricosus]